LQIQKKGGSDFTSSYICGKIWKGYPFESMNELQEEGYISGSKRAKSVFLTREGVIKAKEFMIKFFLINN